MERKGKKSSDIGKILQFLNQLMLSFSYIVTDVLANHVDKVVKFLFFETRNIDISTIQVAFVFIIFLFNIIKTTRDTGKEKLGYKNIKMLWVNDITFFCCTASILWNFFPTNTQRLAETTRKRLFPTSFQREIHVISLQGCYFSVNPGSLF